MLTSCAGGGALVPDPGLSAAGGRTDHYAARLAPPVSRTPALADASTAAAAAEPRTTFDASSALDPREVRERRAGREAPAPHASLDALRGTVVLHIGDSFVLAGLSQALKPKMVEHGVRYEAKSRQSSYTTTWARLAKRVITDNQPDLVIITLGANEIDNIDPKAHAPAVRRIVDAVGGRPCVWVSPPLWRKDTGIVDVIRTNAAPCRFFDSDALVGQPIARQADKIHPSREGGAVWGGALWTWLLGERTGESAWSLRPGLEGEQAARKAR